jgi:DNA-binding SARP family transcriptional activator
MDVRELKDKASQLFSKGKFAKAAETYEEYCVADKKDHQARVRSGDAWAKAGKKDKAIAAYALAAEGFAKDGFLPRTRACRRCSRICTRRSRAAHDRVPRGPPA